VVDTDTLYFGGSRGSMYALDPATGEVRWTTEIVAEGTVGTAPTVVDGTAYVSDGGYLENRIHAIDVTTGEILWNREYGNRRTATPNEYEDTLYFGNFEQELYAVETDGGTEQWTRERLVRLTPMPAVDNRGVYVSFYDPLYPGGVLAFDRLTGAPLWQFREAPVRTGTPRDDTAKRPTGSSTDSVARFGQETPQFQPAVALDEDTVYFASTTGTLFAVDKAEGTERWAIETGSAIFDSPVVTPERVYFADREGTVFGVDTEAGTINWERREPALVEGLSAGPYTAGAGETLYVVGGETLLALDATTGDVRWQMTVQRAFGQPVLAAGRLFLNGRSSVVAYEPR